MLTMSAWSLLAADTGRLLVAEVHHAVAPAVSDVFLRTVGLLLAAPTAEGSHGATGQAGAELVERIVSPVAPVLITLVWIGMLLTVFAMILALIQVLRGPHLADRVLSGDVMTFQVVGLVLLLGIFLRTTVVFDVALTVSIIGFASTLAFAQFIASQDRSAEATS